MTPRRRVVAACLLGLVLAVALAASLLSPRDDGLTQTADLSRFDPGNIITDGVFYDASTMSVGSIQAFLENKGAACRIGADGSACLKNGYQDTWTRPADARCRQYDGAAMESAATIIHKVARACGINPQVILVTLQKEQGLVTTTNPKQSNYKAAMGFGCPDTAACDAQFYWFFNQVYSAARQFKNYQANPGRYAHQPGQWNTISHAPATAGYNNINNWRCGTAEVFIKNQATAGLYNYTPYVPNAKALAAGYAYSDDCGAFGNRNFYNYFTDWFGSTQFSGGAAVTEKNVALKASGVDLGNALTDVACDQPRGGCWQRYAGGTIYWSQGTGAHVVRGAILDKYWAAGGPAGPMGYPISDDAGTPGAPGGYYTNFEAGDIVWSASTGATIVRGGILSAWRSVGAAAGYLGFPTRDDTTASGGGWYGDFQGGSIYWSAATGTHVVRGAILERYRELGGPDALGYPTSDDAAVGDGRGYMTSFQHGDVYWSAATDVHVVRSDVRTTYRALGGPAGLGYPVADDRAVSGGRVTVFEGGAVYWSAATGGHVLRGAILEQYRTLGGPAALGFPTGDDALAPGGRGYYTPLQGGEIYWSADTGAHVVRGAILNDWKGTGGPAGFLGYPTSDDAVAPGGQGYYTDFQGGSVYWTAATGTHAVRGAILATYKAVGGPATLGYPTGNDTRAPDGRGYLTTFQGGEIHWSAQTGAHVVRGAILAAWQAAGGAGGYLGYPTTDDAPVANGGYVTDFQGGSIYWSAATGTHVVRGAILASYRATGGPAVLGHPTGDDSPAPGGGYMTTFQGGSIYWSAQTGAHVVRGGILAAWKSAGGSAGYLGFPTTDDAAVAPGGYVTDFQGGSIYWSAATGTHVVRGAILAHYRTLGGPTALGFPTGDDSPSPGGGYMTAFQNGEVHWSPATGAHALRGAILGKWKALGGGASVLGFPTTDDAAAPGGGGRFAEFQGGSVYWATGAANAYVVRTTVDDLYQAAGGTAGSYGYPVSDTYPVQAGYRVDFSSGRQITAPAS